MDPADEDETVPQDLKSITVLLERAKTGCDDSRERVFEQLQEYLERVATRYADIKIRRKAGVSDIVQQSFVKVVEKFESFRGSSGAEFRVWLKTLVLNESRQMSRGLKRQRRDMSREESLGEQEGIESALNAAGPTPGTAAIRKEEFENIKQAVSRLPDDYQTVIRLRNFENKSYEEISEQMDRSKEAVTKLWYRAILKLQQVILVDEEQQG